MPLDDGLGLDDEQGGSPAVPEPCQPGPEDAVALPQGRAFDGPLEDGQLLAQGRFSMARAARLASRARSRMPISCITPTVRPSFPAGRAQS